MANSIPFTAYFRIVPDRGTGKRFEVQRSRERIASLVYQDLENNFNNGNIALPGGSVGSATALGLANSINAVAVKPQFGESPDTLTVVGFYDSPYDDTNPGQHLPYGDMTIISHNSVITGPGTGTGARALGATPSSGNLQDAAAIKIELEAAITSVPVQLIKLEVAGQVYGHGGIHFPQ